MGFFFFLIYMYPELSSYRIVFCLRLYRISDPCLTSVRYHQISLDVVLWKYLHCPLSFLQTPEPLVFFTFPAQHIKWTNHFVNFFYFIFLRTCILSLHWRKLIINDGLFNSTIRSNKYLQDFPFKHKCIWNKSKKKLTKWKFIICWRGQCIFFFLQYFYNLCSTWAAKKVVWLSTYIETHSFWNCLTQYCMHTSSSISPIQVR